MKDNLDKILEEIKTLKEEFNFTDDDAFYEEKPQVIEEKAEKKQDVTEKAEAKESGYSFSDTEVKNEAYEDINKVYEENTAEDLVITDEKETVGKKELSTENAIDVDKQPEDEPQLLSFDEDIALSESGEEIIEEAKYSLTEKEAYTCLKKAGIFKTSGKRAILYTVIMAAATICFGISYAFSQNYNWLIFGVICLFFIGVIWIVPFFHIKALARTNSDGTVIRAVISRKKAVIYGKEEKWEIPLDKKSRLNISNGLFIIFSESGQLFAIPKRAINREKLEEVTRVLKDGTQYLK